MGATQMVTTRTCSGCGKVFRFLTATPILMDEVLATHAERCVWVPVQRRPD